MSKDTPKVCDTWKGICAWIHSSKPTNLLKMISFSEIFKTPVYDTINVFRGTYYKVSSGWLLFSLIIYLRGHLCFDISTVAQFHEQVHQSISLVKWKSFPAGVWSIWFYHTEPPFKFCIFQLKYFLVFCKDISSVCICSSE